MAKMTMESVKTLFTLHRDRLIAAFLLLLTLAAFYRYMQKQGEPYDVLIEEVLKRLSKTRVPQTKDPPIKIVEDITAKPPTAQYEEISKRNIFQNANDRLADIREIQRMYEQATASIEMGHAADAIKVLDSILERDPQEARWEYPIKPSALLEKARKEIATKDLLVVFDGAEEKFHEAEKLEKDGDLLKSQAAYQSSLDSYKTLLDEVKETQEKLVSAEIVTKSESQVAEINQRIERLTQITFRQEVQNYYQQATEKLQTVESKPIELADARDLLSKALERIKEVDPSHQIVAGEMVNQIDTAYQTTLADITRRVPVLYSEGKTLSDQGRAQKNLDTLNQSLAAWEAVAKLNPEYQNIQAELRSLNEVIASLSGEQIAAEARKRIELAKQALQALEEAIRQEDFEAYQNSRNEGVEHCAFVRGLTASGLDALKSEAVQLERQLRQTQFPPPVDDWELVMITERPSMGRTDYQVRLKKKGSLTTVDLSEGDRDPASGLTVVEVDRENRAFVWVRKPDHRKTKLSLKNE